MNTNFKALIIAGGVVLLILLAALASLLWWVDDVNSRFETALADLRARGEATTWEERAPPPVPDDENASAIYWRAFEKLYIPKASRAAAISAMPSPSEKEDTSGEVTVGPAKLTDDQRQKLFEVYRVVLDDPALVEKYLPEIREILKRNEEAFALAKEAMKLPACRFPLDYSRGVDIDLPHTEGFRSLMLLWSLDAHLALHEGRHEDALQDAEYIISLADALRTEPFLASQLLRTEMRSTGIDILQKTLAKTEVLPPDLSKQISQRLEACEFRLDMIRAFRGARASMLGCIQDFRAGDYPSIFKKIPGISGIAITGWTAIEGLATIEWFDVAIRALEAPRWQWDDFLRDEAKCREQMSRHATLTRVLAGALNRALQLSASVDAYVECGRAGIAVRLYRDEQGKWPESLKDLIPTYLEEMPVDDFTGNPLKYAVKQDRAIIYSVGSNGKDDGGTPPSEDWEEGDITFKVFVPAN